MVNINCSSTAELTDICDVHFVNKGFVLVNDSIARVYVQPTGPSADARITDLECRCRGEDVAPEFDAFTACRLNSTIKSSTECNNPWRVTKHHQNLYIPH